MLWDLNNLYLMPDDEVHFHFELTGLFEGLQFTRYEAPSGKYDKHVDRTFNSLIRKLSFTVQLSDRDLIFLQSQ